MPELINAHFTALIEDIPIPVAAYLNQTVKKQG